MPINKLWKPSKSNILDNCPHCGRELGPWEKVLLNVDRALMCKGCWYRILIDEFEDAGPDKKEEK